jgi:hypothetical protein
MTHKVLQVKCTVDHGLDRDQHETRPSDCLSLEELNETVTRPRSNFTRYVRFTKFKNSWVLQLYRSTVTILCEMILSTER